MSSDSSSTPPAEVPPSEAETPPHVDPGREPRLGILHIMVWTAGIALAFGVTRSLGIWQQLGKQFGESELLAQSWGACFVGLHCAFFATALGGVLLFANRRRQRMPFPRHPGEWLLLAFGASLLLTQLMWIGVLAFESMDANGGMSGFGPSVLLFVYLGFSLVQIVVSTGLFAFAAVRSQVKRWRVFFIIAAVIQLIQILSCVYFLALVIAGVALVVVLIKDRKERVRYPWTHWLGVALYLSYGLAHIVVMCVGGLLMWLV